MEKLGRYEILETLGTGSMGVVYKARDTLLYREIALKTIGTGPSIDPELRERFYREARACALLQHPNIVTVFDLGEADNMAYIVMELLQGDDLRKVMEDKRPVPIDSKLDMMVQVCEALDHAHQHQVVHRDIKPSNIFVQMGNRSKVLDFGIARLPSSKLTLVGRVLGTPNYMAPEQILGQGCDRRSDLFSAAVVFFEFASSVHPYRSSFIPSRIVDGKADCLRDFDPSLPYGLESALARALEREPDRRYQSGEEFAADLRVVLQELRAAMHGAQAAGPFQPAAAPQPLRAAAVAPATPEPAATNDIGTDTDFGQTPPGQESSEWRVSEFLRLLHEFDNSAAQGDLKAVQKAFYHMKKLEAKDSRFATAAAEYGNRLVDLEDRLKPASPPEPPREQTPPPRAAPPQPPRAATPQPAPPRPPQTQPPPPPSRPPQSYVPPRLPEAPLDQTLPVAPPPSRPMAETALFAVPGKTAPEVPRVEPRYETPPPPSRPPQPPPQPPPRWDPPPQSGPLQPPPSRSPQPPPPRPPQQQHYHASSPPAAPPQQYYQQYPPAQPHPPAQPPAQATVKKTRPEQIVIRVAIAFVVVLMLAGAAYWYFMSGTEAMPAVGTAEVVGAKAAIYEGPSTAKVVQRLATGDKVNVLRLPRSPRPDWVRVQYVSGKKISDAGFARSSDLGNWSTLALLNNFRPDDSAGPVELGAYVKSLENLAAQSAGDAKDQVWLETAIQSLALARALRAAGQPPAGGLDHAARALDAIGDSSPLRSQRDQLRASFRSFR
jgi:serine/threonine-protein kinase